MGEARLPVQYTRVKPGMFQAGVSVIVEGRIGLDGVLYASTLMTSCPSKYQADFSVVLFRPNFMLVPEGHPMKVHKNQWF